MRLRVLKKRLRLIFPTFDGMRLYALCICVVQNTSFGASKCEKRSLLARQRITPARSCWQFLIRGKSQRKQLTIKRCSKILRTIKLFEMFGLFQTRLVERTD